MMPSESSCVPASPFLELSSIGLSPVWESSPVCSPVGEPSAASFVSLIVPADVRVSDNVRSIEILFPLPSFAVAVIVTVPLLPAVVTRPEVFTVAIDVS